MYVIKASKQAVNAREEEIRDFTSASDGRPFCYIDEENIVPVD